MYLILKNIIPSHFVHFLFFPEAHSTHCCSEDGHLAEYQGPTCFPIKIPDNDPLFGRFNRDCMNFVRSTTDIDTGCNAGHTPAEQVKHVY